MLTYRQLEGNSANLVELVLMCQLTSIWRLGLRPVIGIHKDRISLSLLMPWDFRIAHVLAFIWGC